MFSAFIVSPAEVSPKAGLIGISPGTIDTIYFVNSLLLGFSQRLQETSVKVGAIVKKCRQVMKSRFPAKTNSDVIVHAVEVFYDATDLLIRERNSNPRATPFACAKGCSACCHLRVEALPPEVFKIAGYLNGLDAAVQKSYIERLEKHAEYAKERPYRDYYARCPFLGNGGQCSVYTVRPHKCRSHLSLNKAACDIPGNALADNLLQQAEDLLALEIIKLYKSRSVSMNPAELGQAVLLALTDPDCKARWLAGEQVFEPLPEGITL